MAKTSGIRRNPGRLSLIPGLFQRSRLRAGALAVVLGTATLSSSGCFAREMRVASEISVEHPSFTRSLAGINGREFHATNTVELLTTGPDTFARMFEMIDRAEHSINLEFFLYNSGGSGDALANRLIARARAGVRVNMIVDAVGGFYFENETMERLRAGGVRVRLYNSWNYFAMYHYRVRTHRRIVVVDGRYGLLGGFGITSWWHQPYKFNTYPVFDLQAYVEGPAAWQLQTSFLENWKELTDEVLTGPAYFPAPNTDDANTGKAPDAPGPPLKDPVRNAVVMAGSSSPQREVPGQSTSSIYETYLFAIESSKRSIRIFTPFLVPDRTVTDALVRARKRGVDVRILTPHPRFIVETPVVYAGRNYYEELMLAGVRIYYFDVGLMHSKGAIFDNRYALLGSTNFDQRSFKINYENDLHIYDPRLAERLSGLYHFYESNSVQYTLEQFYERGLWSRGWECLWTPLEYEF